MLLFFFLGATPAENSMYQKVLAETTQMYENKMSELIKQSEDEQAC
uniref:Uncharacterized protein n=1 Tax=Rhizophora mucronata TaxID=61149 RepID=A0A2P2PAA3_RHIMU